MEKYRLKEEVKKYFASETYQSMEVGLREWESQGVTRAALEEVNERIVLQVYSLDDDNDCIRKGSMKSFSGTEQALMEQALNGELFTKDNMHEYAMWHTIVGGLQERGVDHWRKFNK